MRKEECPICGLTINLDEKTSHLKTHDKERFIFKPKPEEKIIPSPT